MKRHGKEIVNHGVKKAVGCMFRKVSLKHIYVYMRQVLKQRETMGKGKNGDLHFRQQKWQTRRSCGRNRRKTNTAIGHISNMQESSQRWASQHPMGLPMQSKKFACKSECVGKLLRCGSWTRNDAIGLYILKMGFGCCAMDREEHEKGEECGSEESSEEVTAEVSTKDKSNNEGGKAA